MIWIMEARIVCLVCDVNEDAGAAAEPSRSHGATTAAAAKAHLEPSAMLLLRKSISRGFLALALMLGFAPRASISVTPRACPLKIAPPGREFHPAGRFRLLWRSGSEPLGIDKLGTS